MIEIQLQNVKTGDLVSYRLDHASNILVYEKARGFNCWVIPTNSNYVFENGQIIERSNPEPLQVSQKSKRNFKGEAKEDQA
jgi:hypothetical protein